MKDMPTLESLGLLDLFQTDNARVIDSLELVTLCIHVWQSLQFVDQLAGLVKELD
jgi:hypothetical protein